jgi:hypothetical protein
MTISLTSPASVGRRNDETRALVGFVTVVPNMKHTGMIRNPAAMQAIDRAIWRQQPP